MSDDLVKRLREGDHFEKVMSAGQAADRIEELQSRLRWVITERDYTFVRMLRRAETAEAKLARAVEALSGVMVGGNHLATILPDIVPSAETEPLIALEEMGYGYRYEAWCCWRSIMLARTTLAELTGGNDEPA